MAKNEVSFFIFIIKYVEKQKSKDRIFENEKIQNHCKHSKVYLTKNRYRLLILECWRTSNKDILE